MVDGSTCSLVWERRTTCWVTMRVPDPNILVVRRPLPVREGWDLDHHLTACSEGARACWGGGVLGLLSVRPHFCWWGVGAAKGLLPYFLVPKGNQPTACTLALWWLKFGPTGVGGGGGGAPKGLVHNLLMQFFTLGSSKIEVFETCFFDIVTTQNDHPRYVRHVLGRIYVFFTPFGY